MATHLSVRSVLALDSAFVRLSPSVYLQGSYLNKTNVRADSDVDLVVEYQSAFYSNITDLEFNDPRRSGPILFPVTISFYQYRQVIVDALIRAYGSQNVSPGAKCIRVLTPASTLTADVVPCWTYRRWFNGFTGWQSNYVAGIAFEAQPSRQLIVNYPKQHHDNGVGKNQMFRTWGCYKSAVRMFKNARTKAEDTQLITGDSAPSYFLECMLFNVPDSCYVLSLTQTYCSVINWLASADLSKFTAQNGQVWLFGNGPEQWNVQAAVAVVAGLRALWLSYR